MISGYNKDDDNESYFGVFSPSQKDKASIIFEGIGIHFEFRETQYIEDKILNEWGALDDSARISKKAFDLWILTDDIPKIGDIIKNAFPEKKYIL